MRGEGGGGGRRCKDRRGWHCKGGEKAVEMGTGKGRGVWGGLGGGAVRLGYEVIIKII